MNTHRNNERAARDRLIVALWSAMRAFRGSAERAVLATIDTRDARQHPSAMVDAVREFQTQL